MVKMDLTQEQKQYLEEYYHIDADTCDVDYLCDFLLKEIERKKKLIALNDQKIALIKQSNAELEKLLMTGQQS